jgi:hypothetical protein
MAVCSHVAYLRNGRRRHIVATAGWLVFGLAFFIKALAIPPLLFALTLGYGRILARQVDEPGAYDDGGADRIWRSTAAVLRRHVGAWATYAAVVMGYVVVYLVQSHTGATETKLPSAAESVGFIRRLGEAFVTTAVGGPWKWLGGADQAIVDPTIPAIALGWIVVAALVATSVWYRRNAWRAWVILLGYIVIADVPPPLLGRVYLLGALAGDDTRYIADAAPVLALALGLAFLPLTGEREPYRRPLPARQAVSAAAGLAMAAFVLASFSSINTFAGHLGAPQVRSYLANADAALDKPISGPVYDRRVPEFVLSSKYGEFSLTSRVLGPLADPRRRREMYEPVPARQPVVFDDEGQLRTLKVEGEHTVPTGPPAGCWPTVGGIVEIRLSKALPADGVVRLGYIAYKKAAATLQTDGGRIKVSLEPGLNQIFFPVHGGGEIIWVVETVPKAEVWCFGDVTVGDAVPAR